MAGRSPLRQRTLVDTVIDALISGVTSGVVLPGDRIIEADLAQRLGVSRVPIREALRILESQGLLVSEPYKGIRLTPVTPKRLDDLIEARVALETMAAVRMIREGRNGEAEIGVLMRCVDQLERMQARNDLFGFANADINFHRVLCRLSGNEVVCELWERLACQTTVFFGLSTLVKPMTEIVDEHRTLIDALRSGNIDAITSAIREHIGEQMRRVNFEGVINRLREERSVEGADQTARIVDYADRAKPASRLRGAR
ncbi:MAG: hypothetical protein BGP06_11725 [Rhizobiales bacterium 65-9]|nr:MAG: hypothetical protein BGP06_11725 [Rhizobiales bacterium 65-9]